MQALVVVLLPCRDSHVPSTVLDSAVARVIGNVFVLIIRVATYVSMFAGWVTGLGLLSPAAIIHSTTYSNDALVKVPLPRPVSSGDDSPLLASPVSSYTIQHGNSYNDRLRRHRAPRSLLALINGPPERLLASLGDRRVQQDWRSQCVQLQTVARPCPPRRTMVTVCKSGIDPTNIGAYREGGGGAVRSPKKLAIPSVKGPSASRSRHWRHRLAATSIERSRLVDPCPHGGTLWKIASGCLSWQPDHGSTPPPPPPKGFFSRRPT
ncbi:hypothetical protein LX36DRAFT_174454 [Colletotrichum falcatum]|nr:hypothetical protein LX36DRAFT_174454 [Colletotrichum falcatum]